jgi:N6-adenosine-specific RNA methylase IME4
MSALPCGPYGVIVADPPWMYQKAPGSKGAQAGAPGVAETRYDTMTNEQIAALPVARIAADTAHLFLWITNPGIYGGRFSDLDPARIAGAWGFEYRTMLTWVKTTSDGDVMRGGMGWYFRGCTEHVLYATRGKAAIPADLREPNVILAPRGGHSAKPWEFYAMVERVTPDVRRLEMFARLPRPGWDVWGNQATAADRDATGTPQALQRAQERLEGALW